MDRLIDTFGLKDKRKELFKNLSGGLKQRVGIALSLVNDPEIVFLDEPTTGLDPRTRRDVWEAIRALKSHGKTVFLTTHYMDEAYYLADRIDIIHKGKIVRGGNAGRPDQRLWRRQYPYNPGVLRSGQGTIGQSDPGQYNCGQRRSYEVTPRRRRRKHN